MPQPTTTAYLSSFRKQHLNIEFSSLRAARLEGIFVSITPGDPSLWVGVIFVRRGPYAPAVLRFQVSFPPSFPTLPPLVTFSTDVFHPLLTPLTTYTFSTNALDTDTVSATDEERLPPGGFSLRHGFPHWFGRARRSVHGSREVSGSTVSSPTRDNTATAAPRSSLGSWTPETGDSRPVTKDDSMVNVLDYIRSTFSEESVLDSLPLEAAANPGAYHAWRTYRSHILQNELSSPLSIDSSAPGPAGDAPALSRNRRPGEWNWEGVWEDRVKKAVKASLSEPALFTEKEDIIRFRDSDEETTEKMKRQLGVLSLDTAQT